MNAHNEQQALVDAAKSLRTIADLAGGNEYLMTIGDVRGYANSRASVAEAALAAQPAAGFTAGDIADQGARQFEAGYAAAKAELHAAAQEAVANITAVNGRGVEIEWISGAAKIGAKLYAAPVTAAPVDDGMLPDALVPYSNEWYTLCERRFAVDKIKISGDLACAIVDAICARLTSTPAPGIDLHALGLLHVLGAKDFAEASNIVGELLADASPKGATFPNDGNSEAQFIADEARLNCPSCGGSGHVEDSPKGGSEHVPDELPAFLRWCADALVKRDNRAGSFALGLAESLRGRAIILEHVAAMQPTSNGAGVSE